MPLLDDVLARGFAPETAALDKGYDFGMVYDAFEARGCRPIIPLRKVKTNTPPGPPPCEHGTWAFASADFKRKAAKWRCPTGECRPGSVWIKADRQRPA